MNNDKLTQMQKVRRDLCIMFLAVLTFIGVLIFMNSTAGDRVRCEYIGSDTYWYNGDAWGNVPGCYERY